MSLGAMGVGGVVLSLVGSGLLRSATAATGSDAARFIESMGDEVLSVLNRPGLNQAEATAEFGRLFREGFDIPTIGRFVLGRYWNVATPEQRRDFVSLFEQMVINTYARRFSDYSGERFRVTAAREETETDTIVVTEVSQPGNPDAAEVAWRVRDREQGHQIIDVIIEGVSMGVTQRQEFSSVIERAGGSIDALLERMRTQVAPGP
ncbi:ABC transporter substrate-binding protein [Fodinicurvata sp. EGI_FJ10296]|uniref:MlaC/ttg2D family ABC transporter substrate-binding protein n=1 Tax=Fodinicurvata sp. EGI_FJ10296 TaxID=3231908 RepID=UPI00345452FB